MPVTHNEDARVRGGSRRGHGQSGGGRPGERRRTEAGCDARWLAEHSSSQADGAGESIQCLNRNCAGHLAALYHAQCCRRRNNGKVWTGLDWCKGRDQALTGRRAQSGYQVITGNGRKQGWTIAVEVVSLSDVVEVVSVVCSLGNWVEESD